MSDEQTIEAPPAGPGDWLSDMQTYLSKKPSASDSDLFNQFPQLNKDSKRLDAALGYLHGKQQGMSDDDAQKLYPDLVGPATPPAQPPASTIPQLDYRAPVRQTNAAESTGGAIQQIQRNQASGQAAVDMQKKTDAKYAPMLTKAMADISGNRDKFVINQRPALDFHHDAPDSFYDVPNTQAIDDYLKQNIPFTDARYYIRNKILKSFQDAKDQYNTEQIAQRHINDIPAVQQARQEQFDPSKMAQPEDTPAIMKRAGEIDPTLQGQMPAIYQKAAQTNEDNKNETTRSMLNNSTSLAYDANGNLKKITPLDPDAPFHDQITGAGKALMGLYKFTGQVGNMASGLLSYFGAKESGYDLQKAADDFTKAGAMPGGTPTLSETMAGDLEPMLLQGEAMGRFARGIGAPIFKGLSGAAASGMIGKTAEGALGGVALAPINSALMAHQYYTDLIKNGENPDVAHAKAQNVFDKNLVTDMAISPVQFGIMNAPVSGAGRLLLQYGVSPTIAGIHFMAQDYFQQKENNPALTAWKYATSDEGMKTGITGALTGLLQHYVIGKMNDWQSDKAVKDAFSFGRQNQTPETAALPNNNVLASTVLNAFETKDSPKRAGELSGLVDELHAKGIYSDPEAAKIQGVISDVAAVKAQVPKLGNSAQRMAVLNELLNKKAYQDQIPAAGNQAVADMFEQKMKDSDDRIQKIMNEEEPLYFINGIETRKDQLMDWVKDNPDLIKSGAVKIDVMGDDPTMEAIKEVKAAPLPNKEQASTANIVDTPGSLGALSESKITEVRHAVTSEDDKGVTSGPTDIKLNAEGRGQADKLAQDLQGAGVQKVVSSATPRGIETAQTVAKALGIPHEQAEGLNAWKIGDFDKMKDVDFKKAENYFVNHPDETEFEGRKLDESFNQYKNRVITARQKLEDDNQGHTLLVNHGGNINVWDTFQKHGSKWGESANNDYLSAADVEPATLQNHVRQGDDIEGQLSNSLSPEEKQGAIAGGRANAEATALTGRLQEANESAKRRGEGLSPQDLRQQEADSLKKYAEDNHLWKADDFGRPHASGAEHDVYLNPDGLTVTKLSDNAMHDTWNDLFHRIAIHNTLFPDVGYTLKGFTYHDGEFSAILEQPVVKKGGDVTFDEVKAELSKMGFEPVDDTEAQNRWRDFEFQNKETGVSLYDLHGENVMKDESGHLRFVDPIIELSEERKGMAAHIHEAERQVLEDIQKMPGEDLAKLLIEEADKTNDNETERGEAGPAAGDRETGSEAPERVQAVRGGDEAETGTGENTDTDESRPAANRAPGFVRAPGESEDDEPVPDESGKGAETVAQGKLDFPSEKTPEDLESFVRENIDEHKEPSIKKALVDTGGMTESDAQSLIEKVRAERTKSPEDIIREAIAIGKAVKKNPILPKNQAVLIDSGLSKTLKRWYFDGVDDVSDVKSIIRKNKGNEEFNIDKIYHATRKLVNKWNKVPAVKQMAFMLGVEKPELLAGQSKETQDIAASYRERLDKTFEIIHNAMPNLNFVQDYFPHFWEKPDEMRNYMAGTLSKAPLEGGKSFAKKRFFETITSGLKAGYKLATTNPEEIVRLAEANAWKFKTARDILSDMDNKGLVQMAAMGEGPDGWQTVKDPAFQSMAMRMKSFKTGDSKMAALYMPPDVAKLMNDYLSIGLKGPVKQFIQQYNNIKNLFQLGVGFFHVGTTSLDAMVSGMTNGIQKLSAGNPMGLLDLATLGNLPATVARGFKAKSDWNKGIVTADTQALMDANAKVGKQKMYSIDAKYNMMKAFGRLRADKDFKQIPRAAWNALLYIPEAINKPLMEHWVPALKVGGYLRSLDSEIKARPNMSPAELQNAKQKIWDSMDDRLGQVVYDNLFMNKAYKDTAFLAIRSAGWTGGTIRAVSGGIAELKRSGQRLIKGEGLSQRTAYLMALPMTVGIMGALYQSFLTGKKPEEMKDYMFPKDGTKNPDGTDHRVVFPSYMKDILSYGKTPVTTLLHKTAPMLNDIVELYNNKDFYGEKVYNKDDPFYQKGLDILKQQAESMEPFSFKTNPNDTRPLVDQVTTRQGIEQKFGIMPAPKERERTDTQNKIVQALSVQIGTSEEGKTHAQMEQQIAKRHLKEFLFNGGDYKDASDEWKTTAAIKPKDLPHFIRDAKTDPYEDDFKRLQPDTKVKLYKEMSPEDQEKYLRYIPAQYRPQLNTTP